MASEAEDVPMLDDEPLEAVEREISTEFPLPSRDEKISSTEFWDNATRTSEDVEIYGGAMYQKLFEQIKASNELLWKLLQYETGAKKLASAATTNGIIEHHLFKGEEITETPLWPSLPDDSETAALVIQEQLKTIMSLIWILIRIIHENSG